MNFAHGLKFAALALTMIAMPILADDVAGLQSSASIGNYNDKILKKVSDNAWYPRLAVEHNAEGDVTVEVAIDGHGNVANVTVLSSSGNGSLDRAAVNAITNAAPFPAPQGDRAVVVGKIHYVLM
jgi:TonB family protein